MTRERGVAKKVDAVSREYMRINLRRDQKDRMSQRFRGEWNGKV